MRIYFLLIAILFFASCNEEDNLITASANIQAYNLGTGTGVIGTVRASYFDGIVTLEVSLTDQTPSAIRSLHFYDGNCEDPGSIWSDGDNYCYHAFDSQTWSKPELGDIGNVVVNQDGTARLTVTTDIWTVGTGLENDLVGKLFIVHAGPTNFLEECDPNHVPDHIHTNSKVGCGLMQ